MSQSPPRIESETSVVSPTIADPRGVDPNVIIPARAQRERRVVLAFCGIMALACLTQVSEFIPTLHLTPVRSAECTTYEVFDMDGMPLPVEMFGLELKAPTSSGADNSRGLASRGLAGFGKQATREEVSEYVRNHFPKDSGLDSVLVVQRIYGPSDFRKVGVSDASGVIVENPGEEL